MHKIIQEAIDEVAAREAGPLSPMPLDPIKCPRCQSTDTRIKATLHNAFSPLQENLHARYHLCRSCEAAGAKKKRFWSITDGETLTYETILNSYWTVWNDAKAKAGIKSDVVAKPSTEE